MAKLEKQPELASSQRLPPWLRRRIQMNSSVQKMKRMLKDLNLNTVCQAAGCPNICECFDRPTATFMIMGSRCSRNCSYCGVSKGDPEHLDNTEPYRIAEAVKRLQLRHVVLTSVTRDDLPDGGSSHYAKTVRTIRDVYPDLTIEVLIPDFQGKGDSLQEVLESGIDVLNHNVETVPQLYSEIRPEADYSRSLQILKSAKDISSSVMTKSGIMVGLGETEDQVLNVFTDLAGVFCDMLTVGQYLSPSKNSIPVAEFVTPEKFKIYRENALRIGIKHVFSGPYVRSSYHAEELLEKQGVYV